MFRFPQGLTADAVTVTTGKTSEALAVARDLDKKIETLLAEAAG
jgi:hypothetical protein